MLPIANAVSFFIASIVLAIAPGPDILFVLTHSLAYGKKAGLWVAFGNCMGLIVHIVLVTVGLGAVIKTNPVAYMVIQYSGAAYLLYLAFKSFRTKEAIDLSSAHATEASGNLSRFVRGAIVSITNPHVTVLFLFILPAYRAKDQPREWLQLLLLGLIFMAAAMIVFGLVALASGYVRQLLTDSPRSTLIIDRVAAVVYLALAINLARTGPAMDKAEPVSKTETAHSVPTPASPYAEF